METGKNLYFKRIETFTFTLFRLSIEAQIGQKLRLF